MADVFQDDEDGISDERIKQDIRDSNSQWDDIKAVKVRNFKKKDDVRQYGADKAWEQIGVVAQELETVSPNIAPRPWPTVRGPVGLADTNSTNERFLFPI